MVRTVIELIISQKRQSIVEFESLFIDKTVKIRSFCYNLPSRPDQNNRNGQFRCAIRSADPMLQKSNGY
jgi:hypothetical protein